MKKVFYTKGISVEDVIILSIKVFNTPKERVAEWMNKFNKMKDGLKWGEQASKKDVIRFWARLKFGNMRVEDCDDTTKKWIDTKYKECQK